MQRSHISCRHRLGFVENSLMLVCVPALRFSLPTMITPITPSLLIFCCFASFLIVAALGVVLMCNPIYAALCLVAVFLNAAGVFILQGAEFLALSLVIIYVGAVAVLFLFVVMMVRAHGDVPHQTPLTWPSRLAGIAFAGALLANFTAVIMAWKAGALHALPVLESVSNTHALGRVLYTDFMLPFQGVGFVLLVGMVGAITLTQRARRLVRRQDVKAQLLRRVEDEVTLHTPALRQGVDI